MKKKQLNQPTAQDVFAVRLLVRAREDFQSQRKRMDNRMGRKADGGEQNITERAIQPEDAELFVGISDAAREQEADIEKKLKKILKRFPIYTEWMLGVKGVGTIAAAQIIGNIDIHKATTVSKIWQYCGLNPGMVAGKKRVENADGTFTLVPTGQMIRGDKLTAGHVAPFNKNMRTALCGVLADGFIKAGIRYSPCTQAEYDSSPEHLRDIRDKKNAAGVVSKVPCLLDEITCPYCRIYIDYKNRLANSEAMTTEIPKAGAKPAQLAWKAAKPGHRDRAAKRKMIKMFLADLYVAWRALEGLEVRPSYQEQYLGHKHSA
jgi:hypothetical protein